MDNYESVKTRALNLVHCFEVTFYKYCETAVERRLGKKPREVDRSFWKRRVKKARAAHVACSSEAGNDGDDKHKEC